MSCSAGCAYFVCPIFFAEYPTYKVIFEPGSRKMTLLKGLTSVLLLAAVVVLVALNYNFYHIFADVRKISFPALAIISFSLLGNALAASLRFKAVAAMIGHKVTYWRAMSAVGTGSLVGVLFFQIVGQLMGRSFVMARAGVPFESVVVLTAYERIVAAIFSALLALAGAYFVFGSVYLDETAGGGALIKISVGLLAATAAGALLGYGRLAARSVAPWLTRHFARKFLELVALTALVQFPMMIAYVSAAHALSPLTPIPGLVATSAIVMFAASVPISLAGWGVREMSAVVALGAIGVSPQDAFLAAVIVGAGSMIAMVALACGSFYGVVRNVPKLSGQIASTPINYSRALVWTVPIGVATLIFFQIYVPIESGTLLNVNLADPLAILAGVLFVLMHMQARALPDWRYRYMNCALGAATLVLTISLFIGAVRFGWTSWAVVNRYGGWFVLLAYAASGGLITKEFGREGFRAILLTFAGAAAAVAALELLILAAHNLGMQLKLPLVPNAIEGFSLNHNFFAFQLLMALAAVFVAVQERTLRVALTTVLLAALYFSDSRAGWIVTLVVLAANSYMNAPKAREVGWAIACAFGILILLIVPSAHRAFEAIPAIAVNATDMHDRMTSILGGLQLFLAHPIFGAGLGAFRNEHIFLHSSQPLLIHSTSMWLLAELGIVGLLAFAIPALYSLFRELRREHRDPAGQLITLCLMAFGAMSLPADMLYQRTFWLLFGAALMMKA